MSVVITPYAPCGNVHPETKTRSRYRDSDLVPWHNSVG
jgi:hypothetical protein